MNVGERIKLLRKEKGITQKRLAELIHKSEITVRKYESNDISMTIDVFIDILNALDSKLLIKSNDECNNLLREYIDSLNLEVTEEQYKQLEVFIHHYVKVICSPDYQKDMNKINKTTDKK